MQKALTIAGSDSGGGAGIQTDLKTFAALGVYGTSVITALTAQNTLGVHGIHAVPASFVAAQLEAVLSDIPVAAAKTGMLQDAEIIRTVATVLSARNFTQLVVDPVMVAESGDRLLREDAVDALRTELLPLALIVTPNLPETNVLVGHPVETVAEMTEAAFEIHRLGPQCVLIKGGHLQGPETIDIFFDGKTIHRLSAKRLATNHTHGSGCTYAAAITAYLARGMEPLSAVRAAKQFITTAIAHGIPIGGGYGPTNPMAELWHDAETVRIPKALTAAAMMIRQSNVQNKLPADKQILLLYCRDEADTPADVAVLTLTAAAGQERPLPEAVRWGERTKAVEILLATRRKHPHLQAMLAIPEQPGLAAVAAARGISVATDTAPPEKAFDLLLCPQDRQCLLFAVTPQEAVRKLLQLPL
ncbi:MAG: bifunctional hydroxymethylpyrimidine kinase/phosphomethylpyrimidine kinase [Firmicutes bacterium]|jgi:hydroxymethylpyrimidine/phosphomethylpyrimidine kinase|nr:bifunctional hydroxymethylpyrimidine kinase/phosphomethylpyrimidine kinase [Bacillota bacterium]